MRKKEVRNMDNLLNPAIRVRARLTLGRVEVCIKEDANQIWVEMIPPVSVDVRDNIENYLANEGYLDFMSEEDDTHG